MKALLSTCCGGPETLELREVAEPEPGGGEVRIRVESCGINYPDVLVIEDRYQARPARPFAPGGEVVGVVDQVGPNVDTLRAGDRVAALTFIGGLAEYVTCPVDRVVHVPDSVPGPEAGMLVSTYATAYHALVDRGRLEPGDRLLVLGAAGGVGLAAVEIGAALGAHVVAGASSPAKAEAAIKAGAERSVLYPTHLEGDEAGRALARALKDAVGPEGADIVFDPVGGAYAEAALRAVGWDGRYLVVGFPAGIPSIPLNLPLLKGCAVVGVFMGAFAERDPLAYQRNLARLFEMQRDGRLKGRVGATYPLSRGGEAIAALRDRRAIGKLVVRIGEAP